MNKEERRIINGVDISKNAEIIVGMAMAAIRTRNDKREVVLNRATVIDMAFNIRAALSELYSCSHAEFFILLNEEMRYVTTREDVLEEQQKMDEERQKRKEQSEGNDNA